MKKKNRIVDLINKVLKPWGYHLRKYPVRNPQRKERITERIGDIGKNNDY